MSYFLLLLIGNCFYIRLHKYKHTLTYTHSHKHTKIVSERECVCMCVCVCVFSFGGIYACIQPNSSLNRSEMEYSGRKEYVYEEEGRRGLKDGDFRGITVLLILYSLQGIPMGLAGSIPLLLQSKGLLSSFSVCMHSQKYYTYLFVCVCVVCGVWCVCVCVCAGCSLLDTYSHKIGSLFVL